MESNENKIINETSTTEISEQQKALNNKMKKIFLNSFTTKQIPLKENEEKKNRRNKRYFNF